MTPHGMESQISVSSSTLFIAVDGLLIRFAFFRQCCITPIKCLVPVCFERNLYFLSFLQTSFSLQHIKPKDLSLIPSEWQMTFYPEQILEWLGVSAVIAQHRPFELFLIGCRQFLGFVLDWLVTCTCNKCHVARVLTNHPVSSKTKESWLNCNKCHVARVLTDHPVSSKTKESWLNCNRCFELLFWLWLWFCCSCCCNYVLLVFVFVMFLTYRAHAFLVNCFFFS